MAHQRVITLVVLLLVLPHPGIAGNQPSPQALVELSDELRQVLQTLNEPLDLLFYSDIYCEISTSTSQY